MKALLPIALVATSLIAPLCAGDSVVDSIPPATDSTAEHQGWFGPPYIQFARKNSDTLLPGYTVGFTGYTHEFAADFSKSGLGDISVDAFSFWTPIAGFNKDEFHLFAWLGYGVEKYNTSGNVINNFVPNKSLQSLTMPIVFVHDISEKWLWGALVMPTYAGTSSSSDNWAYSVAAGAGYVYSENLELFAGVYYYSGFGDSLLIPGAAFIWRPAPRWEAYLLPPIGGISYSVNDNILLSLYGQYLSPTWHVAADQYGPDRDINMSGLMVGVKAEYHVGSFFWAFAAAGVHVGREYDVEDSNDNTLLKTDVDMAPYVQVGINARF